MTNKPLLIIGAGPMGLAAGYYAAKAGLDVTVLEADDRVGGMAAHFDFGGMSIERYYHFCCLSDHDTLALMEDLGIADAMKWKHTTMGYQVGDTLHDWGDPVALLRFPDMGFIGKLRYGLQAFSSTKRSDWSRLDKISAKQWFLSWCGPKTYEKMWKPLLELKFYEYSDDISAAWMWQRIKRLGNSRKSLFEERLGYIDGGTETLMTAMADGIRANRGAIRVQAPAEQILIENNRAVGVRLKGGERLDAEDIISTAPMPVVSKLLSEADATFRAPYERMRNIGVVCVMLKLKRSVSPHFWVNVSHPDHEIPGIVEFSNLRPLEETVVYVPFYMPVTNSKWDRDDAAFIADSLAVVRLINPDVSEDDILDTHVGRLRHAQPICEVGFAGMIPAAQTSVAGLQIADTSFYYPEDRGVSESIKFARVMAERASA